MTKPALALALAAAVSIAGCGTLFNQKTVDLEIPAGASISGGTSDLSQKEDHVVTYADGTRCTINSGVSAAYVILNIFTSGPIGLIVDGVTGNWKVLKPGCPGVFKR